jgi:glycosyltransferase involved in cell wall biosynthesis
MFRFESSFINDMFINKKTNAFIILILYILIDFIEIIKKKNKYNDGKKFIDKCLNDTNIKNYNIAYQFPLLSIIIPAFNCEKTIQFPISSIQNQNISTFEIILINDFSQDNTSKILQIFQKHDKRVKIINNKKNMGTLYSRCIGTLIAKGEYIFPLDNDDMVFGEDIFDYTIKKAKENNYDIIGFKAVRTKNYSENIIKMKDLYYYSFPNNLVVYQPELSTWILSLNGKFSPHDVTLWGKIIKSKVYIKAINLLGVRRYSKFISWAEDTSMNFIIFNIAETYKFIYKYGILHLSSSFTASSTQPINNNFFGLLFWLEIIFDFSKNNENKNYSAQAALYITKIYFKYKSIINKTNLSCFRNIIFKIIKSKHINKKYKYILCKNLESF